MAQVKSMKEPVRKPIQLMASLYAIGKNSKSSVKKALSGHAVDLFEVLSALQIKVLTRECPDVVLWRFIVDSGASNPNLVDASENRLGWKIISKKHQQKQTANE